MTETFELKKMDRQSRRFERDDGEYESVAGKKKKKNDEENRAEISETKRWTRKDDDRDEEDEDESKEDTNE